MLSILELICSHILAVTSWYYYQDYLLQILCLIPLFSDISVMLKEAPNPDELLHLLADVSSKWYTIGLAFKVHTNELDSLSKEVQYEI